MDKQNMDFGINLAQNTTPMSSSEKRENTGFGGDMKNATMNFLAAEMGGGFVQHVPQQDLQQTNIHQEQMRITNPFSDNQHDDEFEHDSLNISPTTTTIPQTMKNENEKIKFISSTDLDDFTETVKKDILKPITDEAENKYNQFVTDGKNEIFANLGEQVNLEFKVEPDNVKLISSDSLVNDYEIGKSSSQEPNKPWSRSNLVTDLDEPIETLPSEIEKKSNTKISASELLDDFGFNKTESVQQPPPTAPRLEKQLFENFDDAFVTEKPQTKVEEAKSIINDIEHKILDSIGGTFGSKSSQPGTEEFISAENFDSAFNIGSKVENIRSTAAEIEKAFGDFTQSETITPKPSTVPVSKPQLPKTNILQGEVIFHKPPTSGKLNNFNALLESIVYWHDPKISGIVLLLGLIFLLALSYYSVISVIAYTALLILAGTIGFRVYKLILGTLTDTYEDHPFEEFLHQQLDISQERVKSVCGLTIANVNGFVSELKRLFLVESYCESVKFGLVLWLMTYVGSWFNGLTLIIFMWILLFSVPLVYQQNKQLIDSNVEMIKTKINEISDKVCAIIPFGKCGETITTTMETDKNK